MRGMSGSIIGKINRLGKLGACISPLALQSIG